MMRSKTAMGFFWTLLALALHAWPLAPAATAQGSRKDDIVFNSRGVPLAGATVRVCTAAAAGQPCTPLALIYSDAALTQALANPTTTDGLGNYFFYAAPGKYMIEISGPGITTRQIPNVILPSDPTAPSFTSVTSSGGISAFSLNLTGNLTVNGNATAVGSLAGGTLNLTNQSLAPGTASTGTVNLYTKTDKRLYYKDDGGTEIGPIANTTGAQTNVTNTFTAPQNIDADFHTKGPNPNFDITRFGGVASAQQTTGSITAATATLTLAGAIDFANGQGIVVYGAGATTTLATPGTPTVTPLGVGGGLTTYSYQVACEDTTGGITAASTAGSTATGVATLGAQTAASLTSAVRSAGVTTFTSPTAHNLQAGFPVNIAGFTDLSFNGAFVVATAPTSTTFTVNQLTAPNATATGSGTYAGLAYNKVTWLPNNLAGNPPSNLLRCWIYRNGALVGVQPGIDGYYEDYGFGLTANSAPGYVPATPPAATTPGYLATTITAGGGTTTLTLAANAGTTVSAKTVLHDNVPALNAATQAAIANSAGYSSGTVYVPNNNTGAAFPAAFQINSAWQMPSVGSNFVTYVFAGGMQLSQPILLASNVSLEGIAGSPNQSAVPAFGKGGYAVFVHNSTLGGGFPMFYAPPTRTNITLKRILVYTTFNQAVGFQTDGAYDGSGSTDILFDNSYFSMGSKNQAVRMVSGFGFYFYRTGFNMSGAAFGSPYAVRFTVNNYASTPQLPAIGYFDTCWLGGAGIELDNLPKNIIVSGGSNWYLAQTIYESGVTPVWRVNVGSNSLANGFQVQTVDTADFLGGYATPMFDFTNTTNANGVNINTSSVVNSYMPLTAGNPNALVLNSSPGGSVAGVGSTAYSLVQVGSTTTAAQTYQNFQNMPVLLSGGNILAPLPTPAAPTSVTVAAGGTMTTGNTYYVALSALDADGAASVASGETVVGPFTAANTSTTAGNQSLSVAFTPVAGASGYRAWINTSPSTSSAVVQYFNQTTSPITITTYTNSVGPGGGASAPSFSNAGAWKLRSAGSGAVNQISVGGDSAFSASPRAEENVFLPGALTTAWTGSTWTLDKAITVTRLEAQAKTAPAGCTTNAVVQVTDGTTPINVTVTGAANTSGAIAQNYAAAAAIAVKVLTAAAGCTTSPADVNVTVQYKMQ